MALTPGTRLGVYEVTGQIGEGGVSEVYRAHDTKLGRDCGTEEAFWTRKSAEWEAELQTIDAERARLEAKQAPVAVTAQKILELAKKAEILYKSQNPGEQRRLLETVLSNCMFDRGSLKPTYTSPFDLLVKGNETGRSRPTNRV